MTRPAEQKRVSGEIPERFHGIRVDRALADLFPDYSRSVLQRWLRQGLITLDDEIPSQRDRVQGGERVELVVPAAQAVDWRPQAVEFSLVYEDEHIIVVDKPAGLVVHPGAGNVDATLVNGLLHHDETLGRLPRAGIVHRLDKDTTGLMVVARTETARVDLIRQLAVRSLGRTYLSVVQGVPVAGATIDAPIARDRRDRRRMTVSAGGKPAVTHYRVERRYRAHALLRCRLESGRTHQIRVHMRHAGYPIVGDPVYGGRLRLPPGSGDALRRLLQGFGRQALHAWKLGLRHPGTGESLRWTAQPPADLSALIAALAEDLECADGA